MPARAAPERLICVSRAHGLQGCPRLLLGREPWACPTGILRLSTSRRVSPVSVGRETELETLAGAFDEATAETPITVLIGAEADGGKSRLVAEFTVRT
jgi:hypothetical protein